jgi:hypothetical protein
VSLFKRKRDRRRPENAEKRLLLDELHRQADLGAKQAIEDLTTDAERRAQEIDGRVDFLRAAVRVMRRS